MRDRAHVACHAVPPWPTRFASRSLRSTSYPGSPPKSYWIDLNPFLLIMLFLYNLINYLILLPFSWIVILYVLLDFLHLIGFSHFLCFFHPDVALPLATESTVLEVSDLSLVPQVLDLSFGPGSPSELYQAAGVLMQQPGLWDGRPYYKHTTFQETGRDALATAISAVHLSESICSFFLFI